MFNPQSNLAIFSLTNALILSLSSPLLANDLNSVFHISKTDNGNQVHYGIRVNQDCSPQGNNPVSVYWRLENNTTEGLLEPEKPAFGIANQSVSGNQVTLEINGLKNRGITRPITIKTFSSPSGDCQGEAWMKIQQNQAQLSKIHLNLKNVVRIPDYDIAISGKIDNLILIGTKNQEKIPCQSGCSFGL
ncbi:MAG: DUF4833 domain-containing protein [Sphaerospermopsis sp. SIO1G2]|nr:DUF4833 domain-containing protein [Sphaerospermopsis sp. SIO1G1]NET73584.1 DUF4833 domain-containing protein [Sphaerospermopsis sp. SIO1G2]